MMYPAMARPSPALLEWAVKVEVLTGPQGGGKSETMRREAIADEGPLSLRLAHH